MRAKHSMAIAVAGLAVVLTAAAAWSQNARRPGDRRQPMMPPPERSNTPTQSVTLRIWFVESQAPVDALAAPQLPLPRSIDDSPETLLAELKQAGAITSVQRYTITTLATGTTATLRTGSDAWGRSGVVNVQKPQRGTQLAFSAFADQGDGLGMSLSFNHMFVPAPDSTQDQARQSTDLSVSWRHQDGRTLVVADRDADQTANPAGSHWYLLVYANATP